MFALIVWATVRYWESMGDTLTSSVALHWVKQTGSSFAL